MNVREHLLFSFLVTTGCRLDEAALLCWENIVRHEDGFHYIDLTKAIVKNQGSKRLLPIPDCLQTVLPTTGQQATVQGLLPSPDDRLFDYSLDADGKASRAASQALGRQIAKIKADKDQVTHSLRGNLKDMLRDVGVSKEINDYITGHSQGDVASQYGSGPSIKLRYEALNKVKHPYLRPYSQY
jgi:integrase